MLDHIRGMYAALTEGNLGVVGNWFARGATYARDGAPVVDGHEGVLEEYLYLRNCILGLEAVNLRVNALRCSSCQPAGTARYVVDYFLVGNVAEPVADLGFTPAMVGHKVRLQMRDSIWVDPGGLIVRIESRIVADSALAA